MLTVDQLRERLLHCDLVVRDAVLATLARTCRDDATVIATALAAIERDGWTTAFTHPGRVIELRQTDDSVRWWLTNPSVWKCDTAAGETPASPFDLADDWESPAARRRNAHWRVLNGLSQVNVELLRRQAEAILELLESDDRRFEARERLRLADADDETLWSQLLDECRNNQGAQSDEDGAFERMQRLTEAVSHRRPMHVETVVGILARTEINSPLWTDVAVRLAGEWRLAEALPLLIELMRTADYRDDAVWEELEDALPQFAASAVLPLLTAKYPQERWSFRNSVAEILVHLRDPAAVQAALDCAPLEVDVELRLRLLEVGLELFDEQAIEPARRHVQQTPKDPEVLALREMLLTCSRVLDQFIPEFDDWTADAANDRDFNRQWHQAQSALRQIPDEVTDEEDELFEPAEMLKPVATAGRNDPCPCGSGKKYKKCCLRIDQLKQS